MKLTMGVDPGFTGAVAVYNPIENEVEVFDIPIYEIDKKRHVDAYTLARKIDNLKSIIGAATLEQPGSMPNQGVASTFRFGHTCGMLHGILAANFIPVTLVRPNVWKTYFKIGADKDAARRLASSLWPKQSSLFARVKDDGRAEAALLSLYAHKKRLV